MSGFFGKVFGAVGALSSRKQPSTQGSQEQPATTTTVSKKRLFDDEDDDDEDADETTANDNAASSSAPIGKASTFSINEEYARRFEHNKKREERQKLEEKYGRNAPGGGAGEDDDDESSSEDESEDEDGYLLTEELDARMNAALEAIKNKDPRIYNTDVKFFDPAEAEKAGEEAAARAAEAAKTKEKPIFLTDYHRERYLRGDVGADDDDDDAPPPAVPQTKTYQEEQDAIKQSLIAEMNASDDDDDDDEDGGAKVADVLVKKGKAAEDDDDVDSFIKPKASAKRAAAAPAAGDDGIHPARAARLPKAKKAAVELDVANADKDPELFLSNFLVSRAWAGPSSDAPNGWTAFESDDEDDDSEALRRAEAFETAYNLRFEDPAKSNEVLKSYSRSVVAERSVRRDDKTARQRQREHEREQRAAEKQARREERARLRKLKLDEARDKLAKIKEAAGLAGRTLDEDEWATLLDDAWDNDAWEAEMRRQFGDDYYAEKDTGVVADDDDDAAGDGGKKAKKPKKPKWDDDIDIQDIIPDFDDAVAPKVSLSDAEADGAGAEAEEDADSDGDDDDDDDADDDDGHASKRRKTGKDRKQDRADAKRAARRERARLEALVDRKMALDGEGPSTSAAAAATSGGFRYRETSPQSFGLTPRDILLAPSDAALNEFAGLKKLATFRDAERKRRDRKKLGKKARLRQWRRETFGDAYEQTGPTFGFEHFLEEEQEKAAAAANKGGERRKKKKKAAAESGDGDDAAAAADADGRKKKRKRSGRKNKDKGKGVAAE